MATDKETKQERTSDEEPGLALNPSEYRYIRRESQSLYLKYMAISFLMPGLAVLIAYVYFRYAGVSLGRAEWRNLLFFTYLGVLAVLLLEVGKLVFRRSGSRHGLRSVK